MDIRVFTQEQNLVIDMIELDDKQKALPILAKIYKGEPAMRKHGFISIFVLRIRIDNLNV
jgi:hypothetical protein